MAQLCELRTSDTYTASDAAKTYANGALWTRIPHLMLLNNDGNCALRIRIPRLNVLQYVCCLPGVEQLFELSISGYGDWKVAGGVGCNGK